MLTQKIFSLLARMPHTRKYKGKVLPLQTPQAFTNRSYRFRIPNQIPASKMKNGSATYKEQILKNLNDKNAATTEALSTLNPDEVDKVRKINKGKFKQNSRYESKKDAESPKTSAPSKKCKARHVDDDATESDVEQEKPKAKKPQLHTPHRAGAAEAAVGSVMPRRYVYDHPNENTYSNDGAYYTAPTGTPSVWNGQEQQASLLDHIGVQQSEGDLVPLFATIEDQSHALDMDDNFTSPTAVILARRHGHPLTGFIGVYVRQFS